MTHLIIGNAVVAAHVVKKVTFKWRKRTVTAGTDIVDCYLLVGGPCKGVHWQLHPN